VIHTLNVVVIAMLGRIEHHPGMVLTLRVYLICAAAQLSCEWRQGRPILEHAIIQTGREKATTDLSDQGQSSVSLSHRGMLLLVSTAQRITGYRGCLACTDEQDPDMGKRR
jgi:hypothetical protein